MYGTNHLLCFSFITLCTCFGINLNFEACCNSLTRHLYSFTLTRVYANIFCPLITIFLGKNGRYSTQTINYNENY